MKKLSDYIGRNLLIYQKSFWEREFEFRSDGELLGLMRYPKFFSEMAECEIDKEKYTFKRPHIFSNDIEVRKQGYELPIAKMISNFFATKGELDLPRGKKIFMKFGALQTNAEIYIGENDLLATLYYKFSFKEKCKIEIEKRSEILDDYPWIIFLAFYFVQLKRRNTGIVH